MTTIRLSVSDDTQSKGITKRWRVTEARSFDELANLAKRYGYSNARFFQGYRKSENVRGYTNLFVFDIDNDGKKRDLAFLEAKSLLDEKGIPALLITTRNHQKEKHGRITDRFRILVPLQKDIGPKPEDKELWREFVALVAKRIGLYEYVDDAALTNPAIGFFPSPPDAETRVSAEGKEFYDIGDYTMNDAREILKWKREIREEERRRKLEEIRLRRSGTESSSALYVDLDELNSLPIFEIAEHFYPTARVVKERSYTYLASSGSMKFSFIEDENLLHDFIADRTYNVLELAREYYGVDSVLEVAKALENDFGFELVHLNTERIAAVVADALASGARNERDVEKTLKEAFGLDFVRFERDTIHLLGREVHITELGFKDKKEIIDHFRRNRSSAKSPKISDR